MSYRLRHIGIVVADLDSALHFWCHILGFKVEKQMIESGPFINKLLGLSDVKVTTSKLIDLDGNRIELLCFHSHPDSFGWKGSVNSTGLTHIALTVENVDWVYGNLSSKGVRFFAEPQVSPDVGAKVVYASGPENLLLEFVEVMKG
jgi:catechol 2,3-dioxygenase-like lactoylglutathione lyase family enzyme